MRTILNHETFGRVAVDTKETEKGLDVEMKLVDDDERVVRTFPVENKSQEDFHKRMRKTREYYVEGSTVIPEVVKED